MYLKKRDDEKDKLEQELERDDIKRFLEKFLKIKLIK